MKNLVIFDLDGTLIDTIADLGNACNYALQKHGLPVHPISAYNQMVGNGIKNMLKKAAGKQDSSEEDAILSDFFDYYDRHCTDFTRPYPGIPELLSALRSRGLKLAVCSNKYQRAADKIINHFFPDTFDYVFGEREGIPRKPDPTVIGIILDEAGVSRADAIMVGDSEVDIQTAHNAMLECIGVTWGFRTAEQVREAHPTHIVSDPMEILGYLQ